MRLLSVIAALLLALPATAMSTDRADSGPLTFPPSATSVVCGAAVDASPELYRLAAPFEVILLDSSCPGDSTRCCPGQCNCGGLGQPPCCDGTCVCFCKEGACCSQT